MSTLVYGLHDMEEYADRTLESVGYQNIRSGVEEWLRAYTDITNRFLSLVMERNEVWNNSPVARRQIPYVLDFQPVDEDGKADPVTSYLTYEIGLPLFRRELADGVTWERSLVRTVQDVSDWLMQIQQADSRFFRTIAKRALFYNSGWTFYSHEEDVDVPATIPILPLANADSQTYPDKLGNYATAQHYSAQAAQVSDSADPFPGIVSLHKTYATALRPQLVSFVNGTALVAGIRGLTDMYLVEPTRFVRPGTGVTTLDDAIQSNLYFGDEVIGEHASGVVVVQWDDLPDNYIVTMDFSDGNRPLGMREKKEQALRGLITRGPIFSHYGNEEVTRVRRIAGAGVVNRTAASVKFVAAGDTTYDVPTGYTPLA